MNRPAFAETVLFEEAIDVATCARSPLTPPDANYGCLVKSDHPLKPGRETAYTVSFTAIHQVNPLTAMPRNYGALPPQEVRRRDRAVTDESWIREYLQNAPYGALATVDDGQPFINSNLFVYDEDSHAVYIHTARVGRTQANIDTDLQGVPACFSAFSMGRLLPAKEALEFSVEYEGVTVFGTASVVTDPGLAERALQLLLDKYAPHLRPGTDYRPITADELKRTGVFKIAIDSWSGKRKEVGPDFPGAFYYPVETGEE